MINGLQLTESDTKALLNYTHGCIKPSSIKSWLRKNETKLSASELGADRKKAAGTFHTEYEGVYATEEVIEGNGTDQEEIDNIEHYIMELQDEGPSEDTALSESPPTSSRRRPIHSRSRTRKPRNSPEAMELVDDQTSA